MIVSAISILGDPGADSGGERKSTLAGKYGTKKRQERREKPLGTISYQTSSKLSPSFWLLIAARKCLCFSAQICLSIGQPSDLLYTPDRTNSVHRTLLQCRGLIQDYAPRVQTIRDNQRKFRKEHDFKPDLAKQNRYHIIERVRFQNTAIILERLLVKTKVALK